MSSPVWHTLDAEAACERLRSGPEGLTTPDAVIRLAETGPNELRAAQQVSAWALLGAQFRNVLIVILLVATALSALLGHEVEAIAITVIVIFAVGLGFVQEYRAEHAIEALRVMAAPIARVLRDGQELAVPARDVVPGDVLVLRAGDRIAADARLLEAVNLEVQEGALTGESLSVAKQAEPLADPTLAIGDRRNMAYAGTAATYGRGLGLVVGTGMATAFGQIADMLASVEVGRTPLQDNLDRLGRLLARAAVVIVLVIVAVGVLRGQPFIEMLVFGIALAVAVVPEALPAVVTISLALGVQRLAKRGALMRRLAAVETLGSTSVICSDKTGTLTRDEMTARRAFVAGRWLDISGAGYAPVGAFTSEGEAVDLASHALAAPLRHVLRAGALASDAVVSHDARDDTWTITGDPTEAALVVAAAKAGMHKSELEAIWPRVHEIPFTSETRRMTTLHRADDGLVAYAKGAPEVIVPACVAVSMERGDAPLDEATRLSILEAAREMAGDALRVLAVAGKEGASIDGAESDMTFLGLVGLSDPPRPEAKAAARTCEEAGIRVVMITGDHPLTALSVAREIGLPGTSRVVSGVELDGMSDDELGRDVEAHRRLRESVACPQASGRRGAAAEGPRGRDDG